MISSTELNIMMLCFLIFITSCINKDVYEEKTEEKTFPGYVRNHYPHWFVARNINAENILETNGEIFIDQIEVEIPSLKYNKSWLFILTQDDCKHAAYITIWAAINSKPLCHNYYYNTEQFAADDLPPYLSTLNRTLGSSDWAWNEIHFVFTTTLAPEWEEYAACFVDKYLNSPFLSNKFDAFYL